MNQIRPVFGTVEKCRRIEDPALIGERYSDLLGDESKLRAERVAAIYLPENPAQAAWAFTDMRERGDTGVLSAGRTGISGGAVPLGGAAAVSLAGMNRPLGLGRDGEEYYVRVEGGFSLASLQEMLARRDYSRCIACTDRERLDIADLEAEEDLQLWFPVNPTETSARIGGIVATNASGARSFRYGATREWVRALTVVLPDGRLLKVRRGGVHAVHGRFLLENQDGSLRQVLVADLPVPPTKATLGYPLASEMDLIDLFIGSEGTLGMVVEVELRLARRPTSIVGVLVAVAEEEQALQLARRARTTAGVAFDAIEYFDHDALALLRRERESGGSAPIPEPPDWDSCAVYLEVAGSEEETDRAEAALEEMLEQTGIDPQRSWAAMDASGLADQLLFRHRVPEVVNRIIARRRAKHPGLHKVGTDMAVPDAMLESLFAMYRRDLATCGIDSVIFGHIGNNHVHVNLLPNDLAELDAARHLIVEWARQVVSMQGAVAAEHGIGRLKKDLLAVQYTDTQLAAMQAVRRGFDPEELLAPGVLLD